MRRLLALRAVVLLVGVGCSDEPAPAGSPQAGGTAGSLSAVAGTGSGLSGAGAANGGSGGTSSLAGSSGATAGGSAGSAGAPLAGGQGGGGGSGEPGAALDGQRWDMECTKADAGNLCAVLPPGVETCPNDGYTSTDKTIDFGGTPGKLYNVTLRFQGTHEAGDYSGGTANPPQFLKGAAHQAKGLHTWLSLEVSSPKETYNPNSDGGGGTVKTYDYMATIPVEGGATLSMKGFDIDCLMHHHCPDNSMPCMGQGLVIDGIPPAPEAFWGAFLLMTVVSVQEQ